MPIKPKNTYAVFYRGTFRFWARSVSARKLLASLKWVRTDWIMTEIAVLERRGESFNLTKLYAAFFKDWPTPSA